MPRLPKKQAQCKNGAMLKILKWLLWALAVLMLVAAALLFGVHRWLGTDDFRTRVQDEAGRALGVALVVDRIEVDVWPVPAVALNGLRIRTQPELAAGRIEVRPRWRQLLQGQVALATVLVRQAVLPQAGIDALLQSLQKKEQETKQSRGPEGKSSSIEQWLPQQTVLDDVTWISPKGAQISVDATARLDAQGLPDDVAARITRGLFQGAAIQLGRHGQSWDVAANLAGGTVKGRIQWQPAAAPGQPFTLEGQLDTRAVDVATLIRAGQGGAAQAALSGRLEGTTALTARTTQLAGLAEALQTRSALTVRDAVVHGIDLAKAVTTMGLSRGGETRLDTLAAQVVTQGRTVHLRSLVASSGALSATGDVSLSASRQLSGQVSVNLAEAAVGKAVGVPLLVGGTLDSPSVTLTRSAMIGAAIGTVIMPGVGTGAGASLGDKLGNQFRKLFGN